MNYEKILCIFYILILGVFNFRVESFTPDGRVGHSSILLGTNLYFFGGATGNNISSNEVFYLDASQTFNTVSPPWIDLTKSAGIPFGSSWAGMSLIDTNDNPTAYLFGGVMQDLVSGNDRFVSNVNAFNIKTLDWKMPYINVNGKTLVRRRGVHTVSDNKGKIYIFGGRADAKIGFPTTQLFNDMLILDITSQIWSYGTTHDAPTGYSATMLTNGVIVYIGGHQSGKAIDISQINLYDTKLGTWSTEVANNPNLVASRFHHSAVLTPDNDIIIYGGEIYVSIKSVSVEPNIAVLKTQNTPFEWTVPNVSSNIGKIPSLFATTANLIGNHMIIAFGGVLPSYIDSVDYNSKIYIMDIRNYTWVDTFEIIQNTLPKNPDNSPSTPTPNLTPAQTPAQTQTQTPTTQTLNSEYNKMRIMMIGAICGVIGILFLSFIGFIGYKSFKKHKRRQSEILNIPGSI